MAGGVVSGTFYQSRRRHRRASRRFYLALLFELALVTPFVAVAHALLRPG